MFVLKEKYLKTFFDVGILIKGIDGVLQTAAGIALYLMGTAGIHQLLAWLVQKEILEDPGDYIANYLLRLGSFSPATGKFAALFLLSHGTIKILLAWSLIKNRLWAYPLGILIFSGFGFYQLYLYTRSGSGFLLLLTLFDAIVVWLTWHEYRLSKRALDETANTNRLS